MSGFIPAARLPQSERLSSTDYSLTIRQEPERAKVAGTKEKERKPVDPPPIIQLHVRDPYDPAGLCDAETNSTTELSSKSALAGTLVSSLHRLKDQDNTDGGFFVFGDLSVKVEGQYRLQFTLFEMLKSEVVRIKSVISTSFTVYSPKSFPGLAESTSLSRNFGDQGVRLRIRKEPRAKRPRSPDPWRHHADPMLLAQAAAMGNPSELPSQSSSSYSGLTDFSTKRQRTSIDLGDRSFYETDRYAHRTYVDPRPQLHSYTPRDQQINAYSSGFVQAPQTAISSVSEYSLGHQRTSSSNASSPYNNISPHTEIAGHPWTGSSNFYQPNVRDPLSHYQQAQYSDVQQNRSTQFTDLYQRAREQHPTTRMQLNPSAYSFPRAPESESLIGASYNQTPRTMTVAPSYTNSSSRLLSTDQTGDSFGLNRQQYASSAMPSLQQVLPPLESTVSSGHSRGTTQQQLSNNILPSIEPQSVLSSNSQAGQDNTQETYDPSAFNFSYPNTRGPECDDG